MSQRLRKLYEREKMLIKINKARGILGEYLFVRINNEKNSLEYWPIINSTITTGHYDSVMYRQGLYNLFDDRDIYLKMNHQRFCGFKLLFNMPARSFKSLFRTIVFISKSYDAAWKMPPLCIKMYKDRARDYMGRISVSCCLCVCVCVCVCVLQQSIIVLFKCILLIPDIYRVCNFLAISQSILQQYRTHIVRKPDRTTRAQCYRVSWGVSWYRARGMQ